MSSPAYKVDLGAYRSGIAKVYAGRPRGEEVRRTLGLAERELQKDARIEVTVPNDTYSVTSSFILGLLGDAITRLREDGFRRVYHFNGRDITPVIEDAIQAVLHVSSPFASKAK